MFIKNSKSNSKINIQRNIKWNFKRKNESNVKRNSKWEKIGISKGMPKEIPNGKTRRLNILEKYQT